MGWDGSFTGVSRALKHDTAQSDRGGFVLRLVGLRVCFVFLDFASYTAGFSILEIASVRGRENRVEREPRVSSLPKMHNLSLLVIINRTNRLCLATAHRTSQV